MNFVEPIRDRKTIAQIKNQLCGQCRFRDLLLFVVGINTALRISDLLTLRIGHFIDEQKRVRQRFWNIYIPIKTQKTPFLGRSASRGGPAYTSRRHLWGFARRSPRVFS